MRNVNNVNLFSGKEWLRNAVNFWMFDEYDVDKFCDRFVSFCYKDRTGSGCLRNINKINIKESDFSFNYIKNEDDILNSFKVISLGQYNSYHVVYYEDEFINDILISRLFTKNLCLDGLEYRGKIIINISKTNKIYYSLLFLNRRNSSEEIKFNNIENIIYKKTNEYVIDSKSKIDKIGLKHPAPYSYIDINTLCKLENITGKTILDPFLGVGSTIIGTYEENRNIGIELNNEYVDLIYDRISFLNLPNTVIEKSTIICGDSLKEVDNIKENIDCVITSPPYFNILKNKSSGVRSDNSQTRQGREYYSEDSDDLGNIDNYDEYLMSMNILFTKIKQKMSKNGYVYMIISDFTINKKETDIHSDFLKLMNDAGYIYCGTSYILQNQKAIYPFGYPYKIVLNHIYQYIIKFKVNSNEHK